MTKHRVRKLVLAMVLSAPLATVAAQTLPPMTPPEMPPIATAADLTAKAVGMRSSIDREAARLAGMVEVARRDRDVIRLNCLSDKLIQVKLQAAAIRRSIDSLHDAIVSADGAGRDRAFGDVTHAHQAAQLAASEADDCVGADLTLTKSTRVEVTHEGDLPGDDATTNPVSPQTLPNRPPAASPFF